LLNTYLVVRYEKALNKNCRRKQTLSVSFIFNNCLRVIRKLVRSILAFSILKGKN